MSDRDFISRDRIVQDINTSFFVEAGAGSGKTTMLVARMVAMVESGIDVSKICAITFTKAAANEFYERFQRLLVERSKPVVVTRARRAGDLSEQTELSMKRCEEALKNIDLCFMGTIDAFCQMVLLEHPIASGIPSSAAIEDEIGLEHFYRDEYLKIINGVYGEKLKEGAKGFVRLHDKPMKAFVSLAGEFMKLRDMRIELPTYSDYSLDKMCRDEKEVILQLIHFIRKNDDVLDTAKAREAFEPLSSNYGALRGSWDKNMAAVLNAFSKLSDFKFRGEGLDEHIKGLDSFFEYKRKKWSVKEGAFGFINNLETGIYVKSVRFIREALVHVEESLRKAGKLTFFDYLLYLRNLLRKDAEGEGVLIQHIASRHAYFLIDECQDTDPIQSQIFFYLAAKEPDKNWRNCIPRPGSLFIVGDPKQSIYRFKNADVSSYMAMKELFKGEVGECLSLSRNFRSVPLLCSYFNERFSKLFGDGDEDQSSFDPIPIEKESDGLFEGLYYYDCRLSFSKKIEREEEDSYRVAQLVAKLINNDNYRIKDRFTGLERTLSFGDFMLITPGKDALVRYSRELRELNIPFFVEGKIDFSECPGLREIVRIYKAVACRDDERYFLEALCGEFLGADELMVADGYNRGVVFDIGNSEDAECNPVLRSGIAYLRSLYSQGYRRSSDLFRAIFESAGFFAKIDSLDLEYIYYVLEILRDQESSRELVSLVDGAEFLSDLISGKLKYERCLSLAKQGNRVHLANLHKVKGLEAPVVILCSPRTTSKLPSKRIEYGSEGAVAWVFDVRNENKQAVIATSGFNAKLEREKKSLEAEGIRLLYVAATRARNVLIVSRAVKENGSVYDGETTNRWLKLLNEDFKSSEILEDVEREKSEPLVLEAGELYGAGPDVSGVKKQSVEFVSPSRLVVFECDEEGMVYRNDVEYHDPRVSGTYVHELLEMIVSSKGKYDIDSIVEEDEDGYYHCLLQGVADVYLNGGFVQTNGVSQDLYGELMAADEVFTELPFSYREGDVVYSGIMDVVYRKGDKWRIVDYKTNFDSEDLDSHYREQLNAYVKAFRELTGEEASAHTYHVDIH